MKIRKPKSSNSPEYLPPGHEGDHAAHHDLAGLVAEDYDRDHPLMVARWGDDR